MYVCMYVCMYAHLCPDDLNKHSLSEVFVFIVYVRISSVYMSCCIRTKFILLQAELVVAGES